MDAAARYDLAVAKTKDIIDEADPEGLLGTGAPTDEYDSHSTAIARRLIHGEDPALTLDGWSDWFGIRDRDWCVEQLRQLQGLLLPRT